jgi:prophage regulatory protein
MVQTGRLLRRRAVEELTGESRSAIYQKIARGEFPRPVKLGTRAVAWVEAEVGDYIERKIAARDGRTV